jgi:hypothetical protein
MDASKNGGVMFLLVSSNGYTTATIYVRTLSEATETYVALRGLASFRDAVWTLKTDRYWLYDHARGNGEPDWWYEVAPGLYAPYLQRKDIPECPGGARS